MAEIILSAEALKICEEHYSFKERASCSRCPLISECHTASANLTNESLSGWRERLNQLASKHA